MSKHLVTRLDRYAGAGPALFSLGITPAVARYTKATVQRYQQQILSLLRKRYQQSPEGFWISREEIEAVGPDPRTALAMFMYLRNRRPGWRGRLRLTDVEKPTWTPGRRRLTGAIVEEVW